MADVGIKELLEAGVHFGHQTRRWNPRMRRFIYGEREGIHIIDLLQTEELMKQATEFVTEVAAKGGVILFVGTKKQARDSVQEWAEKCQMPYVNRRWLGGLLTNFHTIRKRIQRLHELRELREDGRLDLLPTKERMSMEAELRKLEYNLGGVADMQRVPDAVIMIDLKTEEIALREAERLEIPIIGLVDSNCDPRPVRYVIPGNDDAIRSCDLIIGGLGSSIEGAAATWRAAEEKRRAEEEEKKRREEEERKRREAEEKAKQEAEEKAKAEAEAKARAEAEEKAKAPPAPAQQPEAKPTPAKQPQAQPAPPKQPEAQPAEAKQTEANREAAEERPQPQGEDETKPHNARGSQEEANRETAIEVPQPPPSDEAEPAPEPAPTQSGGES
jgi:small subunit ribosomal protein S2